MKPLTVDYGNGAQPVDNADAAFSRPAEPKGNEGETGGNSENTVIERVQAAMRHKRGVDVAAWEIGDWLCDVHNDPEKIKCVTIGKRCNCRSMAEAAIKAYRHYADPAFMPRTTPEPDA